MLISKAKRSRNCAMGWKRKQKIKRMEYTRLWASHRTTKYRQKSVMMR